MRSDGTPGECECLFLPAMCSAGTQHLFIYLFTLFRQRGEHIHPTTYQVFIRNKVQGCIDP